MFSRVETKKSSGYSLIFRKGSNHTRRKGYSLIEMLIAVTILSGLLIIVLGSLASSSSATAKVNSLRDKSQAARSLVDQITTDFQYVYYPTGPTGKNLTDKSCPETNKPVFKGFNFDCGQPAGNYLMMALKYPGATDYVRKTYTIISQSGRKTLIVNEIRGCLITSSLPNDIFDCSGAQVKKSDDQDILSSSFSLDQSVQKFFTKFSGTTPLTAAPNRNAYLKIDVTVKSTDLNGTNCEGAIPGSCYSVGITLNGV